MTVRTHLGYPILPDQFNAAGGAAFSFSPNTPDAITMQVLRRQGAQLPPDLAAKWAAAGGGSSGAAGSIATSPSPAAAVTPSGQAISTQTSAPLPTTGAQAPSPAFNLAGLMNWLQGSTFGGLPNWVMVGGAALLFFADTSPHRRR